MCDSVTQLLQEHYNAMPPQTAPQLPSARVHVQSDAQQSDAATVVPLTAASLLVTAKSLAEPVQAPLAAIKRVPCSQLWQALQQASAGARCNYKN